MCTVTFTIYHAMATNPIPEKSDQLYAVTLDTWGGERPYDDDKPENPPQLLTYRDAMYLHGAKAAPRSVVMYKSGALLMPERAGVKPFNATLRVTSHEFFPMFDVPFEYGQGWDAAADEGPQPVVVLSHETNEKIFAGANSVGRMLKLGKVEYRVVGVLKPWTPSPKFFDLNNGAFEDAEDAYVPYGWGSALELPVYGNTNCWKTGERRQLPGLPELRVRLAAVLGRIADRGRPRPVPVVHRQLHTQPESRGSLAAPAQQPTLRRRAVARPQ